MTKKLYIIDGNAYVHRAFHALPMLTNSRGQVINAVYGFTRILLKIIKRDKPDYLSVCFDTPALTFRHKEFADYKATRKETPFELKNQMAMAHEAVQAFDIPLFSIPGYEADDLIATIIEQLKKEDIEIVVVSGDKDVLQLINKNVKVLTEPKEVLFDIQGVKEKFGFPPECMRDYLGLCGDTSDNVPGVKGVGEKTATTLVNQFCTIENMYAHLDEIAPKIKSKLESSREVALLSKRLVTLAHDAPVTVSLEQLKSKPFDRQKILALLNKYEFKTLISELIEHKPEEGTMYTAVSEEKVLALLQNMQQREEITFKVEGDHPDPMRARVVGLSFCSKEKEAYYVPIEKRETLDKFRLILENERIRKVGHNVKYDLLILRNHDISLKGVSFDTMVASYVLNPSKSNHSLEDVAAEYLQIRLMPLTDLVGKGLKQIPFNQVPAEKMAAYAGARVDMAWRLKKIFSPELQSLALEKLFYEVELPLLFILADMEYEGIRVDVKYLETLSGDFEGRLQQLEKEIYVLAGEEFCINSPQQLSKILFQKLNLPVIGKTKTGPSTNEAVLRQLQNLHDLPKKIIQYRELAKLKSTYIDPIPQLINGRSKRLHTSFNQTVTATGRLSSSEPNLQNIPIRTEIGRMIRRSFIPEEGCVLLSADYSQIDLRVLAHVADDVLMKEAFQQDEDIHAHTAAEIFSIPLTEVDEEKRRIAKMVNFGLSYGMSPYGLSQGLNIDQSTAKDYISRYFARYQGVKAYMKKIVEQARQNGFVTTLLGRRRYLPEIQAKDRNVRSFAERVAINMPIQGTAADIIKIAMINIAKKISDEKLKAKMLLQVHDELIFEVPAGEIEQVRTVIVREMEGALVLSVPIKVNVSIGKNWRDLE